MKTRSVIENVPKIAFYPATPCPEDLPFPACMKALAEFVGDRRFGCVESKPAHKSRRIPCANKFFVGVSGIGFSMNWKWEPGGFNLLNLDSHPEEHIKRCFDALGLEVSILANRNHELAAHFSFPESRSATVDNFKTAIRKCIDGGMPCIAFGVLPIPEACLVTGYDIGGDVLIGWSHFQDFPEFEAETEGEEAGGYYRRVDWYDHTVCVIIPGAKIEPPPSLSAVCLDSLKAGLRLMGGEEDVYGYTSGLKGYDALVTALGDEDAFPLDDEELFRKHAETVNLVTGDIAEAKCYAGNFLGMSGSGCRLLLENTRDIGQKEAARGRIERAEGRYAVIHDLMWNVWEEERGDSLTEGWPVKDHSHKKDPLVRESIALLFKRTKSLEQEIYEYLSEAVVILEGTTQYGTLPRTVVLDEVPYVGFDASKTGGKSKTTYMAAAMEAALQAIGEQGYTYTYLMGVSGTAFRLLWNAESWDGGNISTLWMDDDPLEHYRRLFRAAGWRPKFLGNRAWRPPVPERRNDYMGIDYAGDAIEYTDREEDFQRMLEENIFGKRYPVLSIATIFPPEAGIICGYDAETNTVSGYHHFQFFPENTASKDVSFDSNGRYVKRNWFRDTIALIEFHHKTPKPPVERTYREAVKTALSMIKTPRFRRHHAGLAAYRAWEENIGRPWGKDVLEDEGEMKVRLTCNNDAIACVREGRERAEEFMRDASRIIPGHMEELTSVAKLYRQMSGLAQKMIEVQGGFRGDPGTMERLREQKTRDKLAGIIRAAAGVEGEIAGILGEICDSWEETK